MKVGDLVKPRPRPVHGADLIPDWSKRRGIVVRVFMHKLWETDKMGKAVKWDEVKPQPFAEVLWSDSVEQGATKMPQIALEVVSEGR